MSPVTSTKHGLIKEEVITDIFSDIQAVVNTGEQVLNTFGNKTKLKDITKMITVMSF